MKRSAFTLVELMIIIGILAILAAIVLPSLSNASGKAQATTIASNMRALADACRVVYERTGTWPTYDWESDGITKPVSLDGVFSDGSWNDMRDAWGTEEITLSVQADGLTLGADGTGDYTEIFEELERLMDDGSSNSGLLVWQATSGSFQARWVIAE